MKINNPTRKKKKGSLKENHKEFIKNNRKILKSQQRFKSKKPNVFTEEVNKIALSANNDKKTQTIDSVESYAYVISNYIKLNQAEIKCSNIIKKHKND